MQKHYAIYDWIEFAAIRARNTITISKDMAKTSFILPPPDTAEMFKQLVLHTLCAHQSVLSRDSTPTRCQNSSALAGHVFALM